MFRTPGLLALVATALLAGCDNPPPASSGADASYPQVKDAGALGADASTVAGDASLDRDDASSTEVDASAGGARTTLEIGSGGGRLTGGGLTLDVQLGHPVKQQRATNGARSLEGGAAVKP